MKRFWVACCLAGFCGVLQGQSPAPLIYNEPPDLPSHYPNNTYPSIGTLGLGTNVVSGTVSGQPYGLTYLGDFDDSFSVTLPAGLLLSQVQVTITNYTFAGGGGGACAINPVTGVSPSGVFAMPSLGTAKCLGGGDTTYTYNYPADFNSQTPGTFPVYIASAYNPTRTLAGAFGYSISFITVVAPTPLTISTPATLPAASVGTAYSQPLQATGGTPPYSWQIISGSLPSLLSIALNGTISGQPTVSGVFPFTARVIDSALTVATQSFTLTVTPKAENFSSALRIPQIVDGAGWQTLFAIVNIDQQPVEYNFRFWDDNGKALALPIVNGTPGSLTSVVQPGATVFAATPGTAAQSSEGWAEVASSGRVGVTAIFQYTSNGVVSQGTANGVLSGSDVFMPFDNTNGYSTGLAIANTNATQPLSVTLVFTADTGAQSTTVVTLPAHAHNTYVLPSAFPALANLRGTVEATAATADIAMLGLRFSPTLSFTSLGSFQ